jgi:two-component system, LytTR family, response regulator
MIDLILKAIIVDDDVFAITALEKLLSGYPQIKIVDKITVSSEAVHRIIIQKPDILFMDIQMPCKNGIEIVKEVYKAGLKPCIIFITGYEHFAIQAIHCAAFEYLLKPVNPEELRNALDKLIIRIYDSDYENQIKHLIDISLYQPKLKLNSNGGFILINPLDIFYIQADWSYSEIYFDSTKTELITMNLGTIEKMLPKRTFYRLNRSYIINICYLDKVNRKKREVHLRKDGMEKVLNITLLNLRKLESSLHS